MQSKSKGNQFDSFEQLEKNVKNSSVPKSRFIIEYTIGLYKLTKTNGIPLPSL